MDLALALPRARSAPTSSSPTTRTPTGAPSRCPTATAAGGCCAATRSARCSATHLLRARRRAARLRELDRVVVAARQDRRRRTGSAYAETLTGFKWIGRVAGPRVRLRGGARLLRRPRRTSATRTASRPRCWSPSSPRTLKARGPHAGRRARRPRPTVRPARHRPALGPRRRTSPRSPTRWTGCGPTPPRALGGLAVTSRRRPRPRARRAAADRRAALPARGRRPGHRAAVRHRAEAQVLPRGRRPGHVQPRQRPRGRRRPPRALKTDLATAAGL